MNTKLSIDPRHIDDRFTGIDPDTNEVREQSFKELFERKPSWMDDFEMLELWVDRRWESAMHEARDLAGRREKAMVMIHPVSPREVLGEGQHIGISHDGQIPVEAVLATPHEDLVAKIADLICDKELVALRTRMEGLFIRNYLMDFGRWFFETLGEGIDKADGTFSASGTLGDRIEAVKPLLEELALKEPWEQKNHESRNDPV